jgi:hypothetical protein
LTPTIEPLLTRLPGLESRVQLLQTKKETRVKGNQLRAELTKQKPRLERLTSNENWKGNYNLLTQFANTYGLARHASLWSSFGCDVPLSADKEAEFPVSDEHRKPDCIIASKCEVWEFKADSPGGRRDGEDQRASYQRIVPKYYLEKHRTSQPADAHLGGAAIMATLAEKCLRGDSMIMDSRLHFYNMCEAKYECISAD